MIEKYKVGILTLSDKGAKGQREDLSGPAIASLLPENLYEIVAKELLPDEQSAIEKKLIHMCSQCDLILTTGGTGFSMRDVTPEATLAVAHRIAPGISEYMRAESMKITPKGMLSRGVSVIRNQTLIINLPGSPKAVRENLLCILNTLPHGLDILLGRANECGQK